MMLWDSHMHTCFSGDSESSPQEMIAAAIANRLNGITFTDHLDLDYLPAPELFLLDIPSYIEEMSKLRSEYSSLDSFRVQMGIEIGIQPHLKDRLNTIIDSNDFDFVIGSSHLVHGFDPYFPEYYAKRTEDEAYLEYFESILENLNNYDNFDTYGHLDYVVRYGPNKDEHYSYQKFADIIDAILQKLISMDKAMEINTGAFRCGLVHPNPNEDIIRRYRELGGKLITLGADAHKPEHIGLAFDRVPDILHSCGFHEYAIYHKRVPTLYPI